MAFHSQASMAEESPTDQVKTTVDSILSVLRDKTLDQDTRRSKIRVFINERFYFRAMSQSALARNWRKASTEQQDRFVKLFSQLLENTYLGRIEAYTDERVVYLREKNKSPKRSVVYTEIITKSGDIPINYKLARKDNKWMVYDVVIEEVSLISNYRSSYAEIIKKEGMDGLLTKMQEKLDGKDEEEKAADALAFARLFT
jgi:phospholipid transport system substrate-binding protein